MPNFQFQPINLHLNAKSLTFGRIFEHCKNSTGFHVLVSQKIRPPKLFLYTNPLFPVPNSQ